VPEVRFQLDEHMPNGLAVALRQRGIDVLTAAEAGLRGRPDAEYLARGRSEGRVVVTQDRDFFRLHRLDTAHAGIAYCAQGARSIAQMADALELLHAALDASEMVGRLEFM
jgi:predicted nuclease of predicted toxin-antitoxin system